MKTIREYMDQLDEIVRGAFIDPEGKTAIRPSTQGERDTIAKGLKTARAFNRTDRDQYAQTDTPDSQELGIKTARSQGSQSGSIVKSRDDGREYNTGMPVDVGDKDKWQTGAVNRKMGLQPKFNSSVGAKDGKSSAVKKPSMPW